MLVLLSILIIAVSIRFAVKSVREENRQRAAFLARMTEIENILEGEQC